MPKIARELTALEVKHLGDGTELSTLAAQRACIFGNLLTSLSFSFATLTN